MKKGGIIAAALLLAAGVIYFAAGGKTAAPAEVAGENFRLGTYVRLRLVGSDKKFLERELAAADAEMVRLEGLFSANIASSDISRVNGAGGEWVKVAPETAALIKRSLQLAAETGGAFDPTLGRLVRLWGIGTDAARVPSAAEIKGALRGGYKNVKVKETGGASYVKVQPGQWLDLGAIAKGRIADMLRDKLTAAGVERAIIDLGGNLAVLGVSPAGRPWLLGLQHPYRPRGEYFGVVEASDRSVVTSGPYERFFEREGVRYHHIFDPATGYPARSGFDSVSVIDRDSARADALCTALFVMGRAKAEKFLENNRDIAAVVVLDSEKRVLVTPAARRVFKLTDKDFHVESIGGGAE
ncbi:MAG: FAD:protein FMN transferase [bacterium]|nr:FAD:protein FMN transferase [bacterium]